MAAHVRSRSSPPTRPTRRRPILVAVVLVALVAIAGAVLGLVIITRMETGEWKVPDAASIERIVKLAPRKPARTILLERGPVELRPGQDDSSKGVSSVLASVRAKAAKAAPAKAGTTTKPPADPLRPVKLPGWKGSAKGWKQVVSCVAKLFAPFDVEVTDRVPADADDLVLVAVGGRPGDLGVTDKRVGGLAPFNGGVIARPVVFAFSTQLGNNVRAVCETIGMEVAHAYGLDHGYLCSDVMTYLKPCGAKRFVDKDVRCGENKPRNCEGGEPTQNSYRRLLQVLGPRKLAVP
jgi:hypothetical protein